MDKKGIGLLSIALVGALLVFGVLIGFPRHMMGGAGWFAWLLPILFPAFIIGGVILLIIFVVKTGTESSSGQKKTPLEILDERYARAEIEEEEYEQRRRKLETYTEKN